LTFGSVPGYGGVGFEGMVAGGSIEASYFSLLASFATYLVQALSNGESIERRPPKPLFDRETSSGRARFRTIEPLSRQKCGKVSASLARHFLGTKTYNDVGTHRTNMIVVSFSVTVNTYYQQHRLLQLQHKKGAVGGQRQVTNIMYAKTRRGSRLYAETAQSAHLPAIS